MKSALIVTIWDDSNFGNRLQAIAMKRLIESNGYCTTFAVSEMLTRTASMKRAVTSFLGRLGVKRYRINWLKAVRKKSIRASSIELLSPRSHTIRNFDLQKYIDVNQYDIAIVGSDQVWHRWTNNKRELSYYYLNSFPPRKRIAFAASFGFDRVPVADEEVHISGLRDMSYVSCRELSGCNIVHDEVGRDAALVLDPTLCVKRDYWESIEDEPVMPIKQPYLLSFFLGTSAHFKEEIESFAEANELRIIDLMDKKDIKRWMVGVREFIWLVHHSSYVCTDSFHCVAFSILFNRDFTVFPRQGEGYESMYDRLHTLLSILGIETCEYINNNSINYHLIDYDISNRRLEICREESLNWLDEALERSQNY